MAEDENKNVVTIDGKEYAVDDLSENARKLVVNIRMADQEIARIRAQAALAQTARQAYAQTLKQELDGMAQESATAEVDVKH